MTDQPRILTADEVARLWQKGEKNRAYLMWSDLKHLCASHEAQRQQMETLLAFARSIHGTLVEMAKRNNAWGAYEAADLRGAEAKAYAAVLAEAARLGLEEGERR